MNPGDQLELDASNQFTQRIDPLQHDGSKALICFFHAITNFLNLRFKTMSAVFNCGLTKIGRHAFDGVESTENAVDLFRIKPA